MTTEQERLKNEIVNIAWDEEDIDFVELLDKVVGYAIENGHGQINWKARDLLSGVLPEKILRMFDNEKAWEA